MATENNIYGSTIRPQPIPSQEIGIDTDDTLLFNTLNSIESNTMDIARINQFTTISSTRDQLYNQIDAMAQDPIIKSALQIYSEEATERNEIGDIVWVESADEDTRKMVKYLLDSFRINKYIYSWAYQLALYGDIYVRLFRKSDYEKYSNIFNKPKKDDLNLNNYKKSLNESLVLQLYGKNDDYINFVELVPNPAEMYELTAFGKTQGYIKAPVISPASLGTQDAYNQLTIQEYTYQYHQSDVSLYQATEFVHGCLDENATRYPEKVSLFRTDESDIDANGTSEMSAEDSQLTYSVRRGHSMLQDVYKTWRSLKLLEDSLILNRLTKSSIVRLIKVKVGDMPKEKVIQKMASVKRMIEQRSSLNVGDAFTEYTAPGPIENNVYVPVHGDVGDITADTIGGDPEVKNILDIDYFKDKLFSALGIPKQFLGDTQDAAGFNGGSSLSIISSQFAKKIKKIQNTLIEMITDICNIVLISRGMENSVNKFTIKMQIPATQEDINRRESMNTGIQATRDIMDLLTDIEEPVQKLRMLKSMLSSAYIDSSVIEIIQEEINKLEKKALSGEGDEEGEEDLGDLGEFGDEGGGDMDLGGLGGDMGGGEAPPAPEGDTSLPSPDELGLDFTDSSADFS